MNPLQAAFILQILESLPGLILAGANVVGMIEQSRAAVRLMVSEDRNPLPEEWEALNTTTAALREELHQ